MNGLAFRLATNDDADLLLAWRNDPQTRSASFDSSAVDRSVHVRWLAERLLRPADCRIWIAELDGIPVGQARVDRTGDDEGEISVSVAPEARGRGLGKILVNEGTRLGFEALGMSRIDARIKSDNVASVRTFLGAGYREITRESRGGSTSLVLTKDRRWA